MGFLEAKARIRAFIKANWTATPVAWQNDDTGEGEGPFERPRDADGNPDPFIYCEISNATARGSAFGSVGKRVKSNTGFVAAHCYVPIGSGDAAADLLAKQFGEMLEMQSIGAPPAPRMDAAQEGGGGSGDDDGLYYRVSVTIPWSINYSA